MQEFEIDYQGILKKYNGRNAYVRIPEDVTYIGSYAFLGCDFLKSVELTDYTMHIMDRAFLNCKNLESVTMSEYLPDIGEGAFCGCRSLKSIHLPKHLEKIGEDAFMNCGLEEISIPDSVQKIGEGAFQGCEQLRKVKLPAKMLTVPKAIFAYCESLSEIDIPETVIGIEGQAFWGCKALKELYLPDNLDYIIPSAVEYKTSIKITYCGIEFSTMTKCEKRFLLEKVNCSNVIKMIRDGCFDYRIPYEEKVRILMQMMRKTPEDERLKKYFQTKNFSELAKSIVELNFIEAVQELTSCGETIPKEQIDKLIRYAIDQEKPEIHMMLLNYKRKHFGFESIEDKAKGLLLE